jgi:S1-C subfamily serine protease
MNGPETLKIEEALDATVRVDILPDSHGTAVVIDAENGLLLTCHHVAGEGDNVLLVNIAVGDGPAVAYPARVLKWNAELDLAVIKVNRRFDSEVVLGSADEVHVLDEIYSVGFPHSLGELAGKGYVRAVHYDVSGYDMKNALLVDIADGPGTSGGGAFLARNGKLIAIMRLIVSRGQTDGRQVVLRAKVGIDDIRAWLDKNHIKYRTSWD